MIKKRRDFNNCEVLDLFSTNSSIEKLIAVKKDSLIDEGVTFSEYHLKPKYGAGSIINFEMKSICIIISRFKLKKDLVVYNRSDTDYIQLSFLIEGEKIISLDNTDTEIFYENQESYFVDIDSFQGYSRIPGGKIFKEIKIKLSKSFLLMHGFTNNIILKKISDNNIITPITGELLTTLNDLETKNLKGITKKLYLKAKVFELLALQIENYKNVDVKTTKGSKILKKLYKIRQLIKNNLQDSYTTKQLSIEMALNEHILKKEFKRIFGYSVNKFSTIEKMNTAKDLLKNPQLPIYQIAEEVGYKNATHFTVAFKRYFGDTPKFFRNNF